MGCGPVSGASHAAETRLGPDAQRVLNQQLALQKRREEVVTCPEESEMMWSCRGWRLRRLPRARPTSADRGQGPQSELFGCPSQIVRKGDTSVLTIVKCLLPQYRVALVLPGAEIGLSLLRRVRAGWDVWVA